MSAIPISKHALDQIVEKINSMRGRIETVVASESMARISSQQNNEFAIASMSDMPSRIHYSIEIKATVDSGCVFVERATYGTLLARPRFKPNGTHYDSWELYPWERKGETQ